MANETEKKKPAKSMEKAEKAEDAKPKSATKSATKSSTTKPAAKPAAGEGIEEKILTMNLRKELSHKPYWRKAELSMAVLRRILEKKTRSESVIIGRGLNEKLWSRGLKKPDMKLRIRITKDGDAVKAELME